VTRLRVAPIVEGHGDEASVRILLQRIWTELLGGEYIEVTKPIRRPRSKLVLEGELSKAVELAALKLDQQPSPDPTLILVLLDRDPAPDPPCVQGPQLLAAARKDHEHLNISLVLANLEYETWFVAAAESLQTFLRLEKDVPENPETARCGKAWVQKRYCHPGQRYAETVDMPSMTSRMDLKVCRQRSPSFDKLCRELEAYRNAVMQP
jgi:hypothetical protein